MKPKREINRLVLGTLTLVVGLAFTLGVLGGLIGPQMFSGGGRTVTAVFADTEQLKAGDEVRVQGVLEGSVTSINLNPGGRSTTVVMSVPGSAGPLYRNATATLAWKTVLGGAYNVDLTRGDPSAGTLGSYTIPTSHTANQVTVDQLLSFDSGAARQGLQRMPGELATALSNPQPPAQLLDTLAHVAPYVTAGVGAVRGQVPDSDVRSLVSATAQTMQALNAPNDTLRGLVQGAAATLGVTAARQADLKAALDQATPSLQQTKTTFTQLQNTFSLANPLLRTLVNPAGDVAPTVSQLYPTVVQARNLLNQAVPLLHALPPAMKSLATASEQGLPLLNGLTPSINRLQQTILPYMNTVDPATQRTTAQMIGPTTEALGPDIAGQMDQNGHFIRFPATAGSSPLYLPCQIYAGNPSSKQLIACQTLQQTLSSFLGYNPVASILGEAGAANGTGTGTAANAAARSAAGGAVQSVLGAVTSATQALSTGGTSAGGARR